MAESRKESAVESREPTEQDECEKACHEERGRLQIQANHDRILLCNMA